MAEYKIRFNVPPFTGKEMDYIKQAVDNMKICGDGEFTKKDSKWLEEKTGTAKALLTTSCTHALELAALLCDIKEGDEVIMPSFTFVSTADAFVLRGAKVVFVDIRPDTMNIDENKIEAAITERTKAIVPVHYAGVACEMDKIMDIAKRHNLKVVEDDAQGIMSEYKGQALSTSATSVHFLSTRPRITPWVRAARFLSRIPQWLRKPRLSERKGPTEASTTAVRQTSTLGRITVLPTFLPT